MAAYFIPRQLQQLTDSAGKPLPDISTEEIGFLNGVTSPIQTQLNGKYGSGDAIVGVSFTIGANTLDANEWAYLDGQDQPVKTASSPTFANIMDSGNLDFGTTGARLSAASGILTLAGIGNTNNENLVFDFESVANSVV
ncbi:MAG: hypothetical protein JXB10_09010, partial [Pirellulales bacterium]|nr:hypothetical protein [Pirellulales bacterium]